VALDVEKLTVPLLPVTPSVSAKAVEFATVDVPLVGLVWVMVLGFTVSV
jgi:hypothetical protein